MSNINPTKPLLIIEEIQHKYINFNYDSDNIEDNMLNITRTKPLFTNKIKYHKPLFITGEIQNKYFNKYFNKYIDYDNIEDNNLPNDFNNLDDL